MTEIPYMLISIIGGIVLCIFGIVLVILGNLINAQSTKKSGAYEKKTLSNPVPATRIATVLAIIGYALSAYAFNMQNKIIIILGFTGMMAMFMFMVTALIFSLVVIAAISKKNAGIQMVGLGTTHCMVN